MRIKFDLQAAMTRKTGGQVVVHHSFIVLFLHDSCLSDDNFNRHNANEYKLSFVTILLLPFEFDSCSTLVAFLHFPSFPSLTSFGEALRGTKQSRWSPGELDILKELHFMPSPRPRSVSEIVHLKLECQAQQSKGIPFAAAAAAAARRCGRLASNLNAAFWILSF